ncbi:hypothetical protein [Thalassotalea hakodatensis]|uniref:hypothetical protein n=1 Tax=Thalassotalea hakodatensis TaxID=3030492 RepID=UPI002572C2A2|nr:hypothetical protein [Thalassotalea hakodatensis]
MKKYATTALCAALPAFMSMTVLASSTDEFVAMHKQLAIMSKIIKSASTQEHNGKTIAINGVETTYLKGQGVLFSISSSTFRSHWGNVGFSFNLPDGVPMPPRAPIPPLPAVEDIEFNGLIDVEIEQKVAEAMESAASDYEQAMEAMHENHESYRDLRERRRDTTYELREIERELRDHEFQLRRADKESKAELQSAVKSLQAQKDKLKSLMKSLEKQDKEVRKAQLVKQAEREKERIAYYQSLSYSLAETFCLYGNGLKAVPNNENVNLLIKSGGEKQGNRYKDSVIVFSKKDIRACAGDDINSKQLLAKSKRYQF